MNNVYPEWVPPLKRSHWVAADGSFVGKRRGHRHAFTNATGRWECEICDLVPPSCFKPISSVIVKEY